LQRSIFYAADFNTDTGTAPNQFPCQKNWRFNIATEHGPLGRQIIFWLIFLAVSTAIVGKNGWTRPLVILLFINIGVAICSLCISGYAHRSIRRFGAMSPEQHEQAISKMPPFVRDRIAEDLKNDAA